MSTIGPIDIKDYDNITASVYTASGHLIAELEYNPSRTVINVFNVVEMDRIGRVRKDGFGEWDASRFDASTDTNWLCGTYSTVEAAIIAILNKVVPK
jgi:hypothetical protein